MIWVISLGCKLYMRENVRQLRMPACLVSSSLVYMPAVTHPLLYNLVRLLVRRRPDKSVKNIPELKALTRWFAAEMEIFSRIWSRAEQPWASIIWRYILGIIATDDWLTRNQSDPPRTTLITSYGLYLRDIYYLRLKLWFLFGYWRCISAV